MPVAPDGSAEGDQVRRLLGLVFAGSDLVLEVDASGKITFALGAAEGLTGRSDRTLVGTPWTSLVSDLDAEMLDLLLAGLKPGERMGPMRVILAGPDGARGERQEARPSGRQANLSLFRMPELGARVSCALSLGGREAIEVKRAPDGLVEAESFPAAANALIADAERAGVAVRLDLVEMTGLQDSMAALDPEEARRARRRLAAMLRAESYAGVGASEVTKDRFALVRPAAAPGDRLNQRLQAARPPEVEPLVAELALEAGAASSLNAKAVRYALDRFIEEGAAAASQGFSATVGQMVRETTRFQSMLAAGAFQLAYQPVVGLADRSLHHFEALARFDGDGSPGETIRLAEALEMIVDFDLAVARNVAKVLSAGPPDLKVAVNVSAISLMTPRFIAALLEATLAQPRLRPRLLIEITETSRLDNLAMADRVIDELRSAGHVVCLDDFGSGAASLDYMRQLTVDFVKIDGRFLQTLTANSREALLLKHIAALCRDIKVATIAEMIETEEAAQLAQSLGVGLGQGWAFGKPTPEPRWGPSSSPPPSSPPSSSPLRRRLGAVDQWG